VPQSGAAGYASLSGPALRQTFMDYLNGEGGLLWTRALMNKTRVESLEDLSDDAMRDALENPDQFRTAA
jgi:hypothetical protein